MLRVSSSTSARVSLHPSSARRTERLRLCVGRAEEGESPAGTVEVLTGGVRREGMDGLAEGAAGGHT